MRLSASVIVDTIPSVQLTIPRNEWEELPDDWKHTYGTRDKPAATYPADDVELIFYPEEE